VVFVIGLLAAIALPSFLNTTYKDGPSWGARRSVLRATHQQAQYFQTHGKFSEELLKVTSSPESDLVGTLNYQYEVHQELDLVLYHAKAKHKKARVRQNLGPFQWEKEVPDNLLYSHISAIAVGRTKSQDSAPKSLDVINCSSVEPGSVLIANPIAHNGILICGKGTERISGAFYELEQTILRTDLRSGPPRIRRQKAIPL
jgi:type II secretory pathway pseudopilin PulG